MIYSEADELVDCEYVRTKEFVNGFLRTFFGEVEVARARNFTAAMPSLQYEYDYAAAAAEDDFVTDAFGWRTLQYKQLHGQSDIPQDMRPLMNYNGLKLQCDQRHREMKRIALNLNSEHPEIRKNATEHLER